MKKFQAFSAALLATGIAFSSVSCGSNESSSTASSSDPTSSASSTSSSSAASTSGLPITPEKTTFKIFSFMSDKAAQSVTSHEDVLAFQELEKRTNIDIVWNHPPAGQEKEQFNLMTASQDLPDMIYYDWRNQYPGGPEKAIMDQVIIDLKDKVAELAPNFSKMLQDYPELKKEITTDSGALYMFPTISQEYLEAVGQEEQPVGYGYAYRKDWAERVGYNQDPLTVDDWYEMLTLFKEQDANGNGDPNDEIPFVSQGEGKALLIQTWLPAWGMLRDFYVDQETQQINHPFNNPEDFLDFVTTMNKWYSEGLIDPDYVATDFEGHKTKMMSNISGAYCGTLGGSFTTFMTQGPEVIDGFQLEPVPYPIGPAGKSYTNSSAFITRGYGLAITTACEQPDVALRWMDYVMGEEGSMLVNFGIEGEHYTIQEDGLPAWSDKILDEMESENKTLDQVVGGIAIGSVEQWATLQRKTAPVPGSELQEYAKEKWAPSSYDLSLPPMTLTPEESSRVAEIMTEINTYYEEIINKMIMGQTPLSDFDAAVDAVKKMGLDEALKIYNDAYTRYQSR
ncbi:MAG: extracellular solute-binding protein [Candidatus Merdivicinus sp.]|jgi:putative aldouronate transport system substrate-binding protein